MSPFSPGTSTAHQSEISGTAMDATRRSSSRGSSDETSTLLVSERMRCESSARLWAVMSSITLIAITRRPLESRIGVDLTADQRRSFRSRDPEAHDGLGAVLSSERSATGKVLGGERRALFVEQVETIQDLETGAASSSSLEP